jgi:GxxExxY protein
MGSGFLEAVYQECLEREFSRLALPFRSQMELSLTYKGEKLCQMYKPDYSFVTFVYFVNFVYFVVIIILNEVQAVS